MGRRRSWKGRHQPVKQTRPTVAVLRRKMSDGFNVGRECLRRFGVKNPFEVPDD